MVSAHGNGMKNGLHGKGDAPRPVPSGTILFKDIGMLATFNEKEEEIPDGAIFVKGNVIEWVGSTADLPEEYSTADEVMSMKDHLIMPGMVNTHHHMFQCLTRCVAQDSYLFGWLSTCYSAWEHMQANDMFTACKLAMAELILSGCTTSSDHLYIYPNDVTVGDSVRAARAIGMRFHPTRGAMSLGVSKGGLPPDSCCEEEDVALQRMEDAIKEYHDNSKYSMIRMVLAPCSPFTVTKDLMVKAAQLARKYEGVRLHTHMAENQEDIDFLEKMFSARPKAYIEEVGWDQDDVWFAHCCCLDDDDCKLYASKGLGIAHCPSSNMRLASGIAPVAKWLDSGINVGMGVDGTSSNDSGHMLAEVRLAMFLQRGGNNRLDVNCRKVLKMSIHGGAKNLGRTDIGQIAPGFAADFVGWKTNTIGFAGGLHDKVANLIMAAPSVGWVDLSVINGDIIVKDGVLQTLDLQELINEHNQCSARLVKHLPKGWQSGIPSNC
ncbi:g2846 [Coccomyxa viridis]|uniref:G2846 protein n=1 Tax=Coccomyxa viridis TaxID=1274662 RepID=A0ABP1FLE4_9CHLO